MGITLVDLQKLGYVVTFGMKSSHLVAIFVLSYFISNS